MRSQSALAKLDAMAAAGRPEMGPGWPGSECSSPTTPKGVARTQNAARDGARHKGAAPRRQVVAVKASQGDLLSSLSAYQPLSRPSDELKKEYSARS